MHDDVYVNRDFTDLDKRVNAVKWRVACQELPAHIQTASKVAIAHSDACAWSPGMVHAVAPTPVGGELKLGSYPVPTSGQQGLRRNRRQRAQARRARKAAQARTDRIVRALAFGPTHNERVAKQHAIRNAAHVQEQVTDLTDKLLDARAQLRKAQPKREPRIKDLILADLKQQARESVDWDRKA